jgi:hypothetical protein
MYYVIKFHSENTVAFIFSCFINLSWKNIKLIYFLKNFNILILKIKNYFNIILNKIYKRCTEILNTHGKLRKHTGCKQVCLGKIQKLNLT